MHPLPAQPQENAMSVVIKTASKLHEEQIKAATRSQDFMVSTIEKVATAVEGLLAKSPTVPGFVAGPLEKVTAPVTQVFGTQSDFTSYLTRSVRDWIELQQKFQTAVLGALVSDDQLEPAPAPPHAVKPSKKA
jgi:hypothetical protein